MCEAWRDIKGHNGGCLYGCNLYLAKYTSYSHKGAHWYDAISTKRSNIEERNGYMKQILEGLR